MDQVQKNNLSKSIKVFGWFFIVGGFYVFNYIKPLVFSGYLLDTVVALNAANINYTLSSYRILSLLSTVGSIILLAAGILIVRLNDTGRKLAIFYASFGILHSLFWILYHLSRKSAMSVAIPFSLVLIIQIPVIFYFTYPEIKKQFKKNSIGEKVTASGAEN